MTLNKFLWTLPFISFLLGYFLINQLFNTKKEIEVPNLVGTSIIEATKILSDAHLNIRILSQKEEPDLIPGTIISQNPVNQKVKQNQTIYLVVAKKPDFYKVPNFMGKKLDDIQPIVAKENIKLKIYYEQSILPENYCITQFPAPNTNLEEKKILLYISSGNNKEIVFPNFKGKELKSVINLLKLNNLQIKLVMKNPNEEYNSSKDYIIIDQRPFAGSLIKLNPNLNVQLIIQ
ncbi:MAG: PASTA domain-containing protein [Candidatus Babeliales bacterium]|nr:PASTA domain-containing protein [Candidatus Babeliales bacterium]